MSEWPKRHTIKALIPVPLLREIGQALGLSGPGLYAFLDFDRVVVDVSIAESGAVTILRCNGAEVLPGRPRTPPLPLPMGEAAPPGGLEGD